MFVNVHFYDNHPKAGWRCVLVLTTGPKWVTVFYPPTCEKLKIPREIFDRAPKEDVPIRKRILIKRIKDNAGLNVTNAVKEALALVRAA